VTIPHLKGLKVRPEDKEPRLWKSSSDSSQSLIVLQKSGGKKWTKITSETA